MLERKYQTQRGSKKETPRSSALFPILKMNTDRIVERNKKSMFLPSFRKGGFKISLDSDET
jgi:hypothetical protein